MRILSDKRPATKKPVSFILSDSGETLWFSESEDLRESRRETRLPVGDKRLRLSVLFACGVETAVFVFLTVFVFWHSNPRGDGMEMVLVLFAFMLIFLPFTLTAFILAQGRGGWLVLAAGLAAIGAFTYFALWLETLSELGLSGT